MRADSLTILSCGVGRDSITMLCLLAVVALLVAATAAGLLCAHDAMKPRLAISYRAHAHSHEVGP